MRKLHTIISLCAFVFCTSTQLTSQVVFSTPEISVEPNSHFEVPVSVKNFNDIVSIQFATSWNPEILQIDSVVHDFVLDGMVGEDGDDQFGLFPEDGKLRFSWFQPSTTGQTLADETVIFKIAFTVIGSFGSSTPLNMGPCPGFVVEVINSDEQEVNVTFENGKAIIGTDAVTNELDNSDFFLHQNQPNPFTNQTLINFELKNNANATFILYDLSGKVIFVNEDNFGTGMHSINLNRDILPTAGTYFYQLLTTDYIATRRLVVLN